MRTLSPLFVSIRSGRRRGKRCFAPALIVMEVAPTAMRPRTEALRPRLPVAASTTATASHSLELVAALDAHAITLSSRGVGVLAIAS